MTATKAKTPPTTNGNGGQQLTKTSPIFGLASRFEIEPTKLLDVLRGTVIKPDRNGRAATNEEIAAFCIVANQYGLNPFTREIHAFVSGDKGVVPIVGIDGWTHIVNSCSAFDGCEFSDIEDEEGKPISITCKMYVKGRTHAVCATERYAECKRGTIPWNTMPWRMLRHKAYMQAARYAFGLSGLYDEDEARDVMKNSPAEPAPQENPLPVGRQSLKTPPNNQTFVDVSDAEIMNDGPHVDEADPLPAETPVDEPKVDNAAMERHDQLLRIRESLKQKTLTEKAACGWVKIKNLDDATTEQLRAIEDEVSKRT